MLPLWLRSRRLLREGCAVGLLTPPQTVRGALARALGPGNGLQPAEFPTQLVAVPCTNSSCEADVSGELLSGRVRTCSHQASMLAGIFASGFCRLSQQVSSYVGSSPVLNHIIQVLGQ